VWYNIIRKKEREQTTLSKKIKKLFKNPLTNASKCDIINTERKKERIQQ
jgi:hypothetical protein